MLTIGFAGWTVLWALCRRRALTRCTNCEPRCPNGHHFEIAGLEGMLFVAISVLLLSLVEKIA